LKGAVVRRRALVELSQQERHKAQTARTEAASVQPAPAQSGPPVAMKNEPSASHTVRLLFGAQVKGLGQADGVGGEGGKGGGSGGPGGGGGGGGEESAAPASPAAKMSSKSG